jgi:hypothetical protein
MDNLPEIIIRWLPVIAVLAGIGSIVNFGVRQLRQVIREATDEVSHRLEKLREEIRKDDLPESMASGFRIFLERQLRHEVGETNEQALERWMSRRYGFEEGTTDNQELFFTMRDVFREQGKIPKAK